MKIYKNKIFIIFVVLALAVVGWYFASGRKTKVEYITAKVTRGSLIQTVSETGTVKANKEIDLNFLSSGEIASVLVEIGDKVKKDQVLAELDNSGLMLKEKEAEANLRVAQANLAKLLAGATSAELAVSQAGVNQAKTAHLSAVSELEKVKNTVNESIAQAEKSLNDLHLTSGSTITSYQRAVENYKAVALTTVEAKISVADNALDNINTILTDNDARNYLGAGDSALLDATKNSHKQALFVLTLALSSLNQAKADGSSSSISLAASDTLKALNYVFEALKNCYNLLESSLVGGSFTQTKLDTYKTNISAQQTSVSAGITAAQTAQHNLDDSINNLNNAILAAENTLATAKVTGEQQITAAQAKADTSYQAWKVAEAQYNQLKTGARSQDINLAQAQVSQAQAALDLVKNQIGNNIIKAPTDGVITKKNYEAGEQSQVTKPVFSLLGDNNFLIEVDVSEADINKVEINDPVEITLDAFGEDVKFSGLVNFIEPAETVIQDVIYYKLKINFDGQDKNVKSGMTANVSITTARKDGVLLMPSRAVVEKNGNGKIVRLLSGTQIKEMPVSLGLSGDNGLVEVLSGAGEGETVVTYIK